MWRENEKTLSRLFTSHYHPLCLTSVLHLHHTFYSAYPLSFFIPPSSSSFSRFFSAPSSHCTFTRASVAFLGDLPAHTYCGCRMQVIMKCLGKED